MSKLLSIVVPVYNVENYIVQCLESITYDLTDANRRNLEVILINDCTPDNSMTKCRHIIEENKDIIKVINHSENLGLGGARNTGIDHANGKFIAFLDSDDYYFPGTVNNLISVVDNENSADIFVFGLAVYKNKEFLWDHLPDLGGFISGHDGLMLMSQTKVVPSACNKLFRKSLVQELKFTPHIYYEDLEFTPVVFQEAKKVYFIDKIFYCYRQDGLSITRIKTKSKHIVDLDIVLRSLNQRLAYKQITANFFFSRWAYHLKKWELEETLIDIALKKIINFIDSVDIQIGDYTTLLDFDVTLDQICQKYPREIKKKIQYIQSELAKKKYNDPFFINHKSLINNLVQHQKEILELNKQKQWYENTYESLPWWWKKVGALIRRLK